jgi:hypothetical protein
MILIYLMQVKRKLNIQPVIDPDQPTHLPGWRQSEIRKTKYPAAYQIHILLTNSAGRIHHLEFFANTRQLHFHPSFHRLGGSPKDRHFLKVHKNDPQLWKLAVFKGTFKFAGHHPAITIEIFDIDGQRS